MNICQKKTLYYYCFHLRIENGGEHQNTVIVEPSAVFIIPI